jgi:hypothetical protein
VRILVTGSRRWPDADLVNKVLSNYRLTAGVGEPVTIVHGHCPTGADAMADLWTVSAHSVDPDVALPERHPAEWDVYGKAAGPLRNQEMVDLGADLCLGFLMPDSRGTRDCIQRARDAGIAVVVHTPAVDNF